MKILNLTFVKFNLSLISGIVTGYFFHLPLMPITMITGLLLCFLGILKQLTPLKRSAFFGIIALIMVYFIGLLSWLLYDARQSGDHYSHLESSLTVPQLELKIGDEIKPTKAYFRFEAEVLKLNQQEVRGKVLFLIARNHELAQKIYTDEIVKVSAKLTSVQGPLYPHQFQYKKFLELKNIFHQVYISQNTAIQLHPGKRTFKGYAAALRDKIINGFSRHGMDEKSISVLQALLLGDRTAIDSETYEDYQKAGAMHILALSGLHIGIILGVLNVLFSPLHFLRHGRRIKFILVLIVLWSFAGLAGFSSSLVRAVTMFSFLGYAQQIRRITNTYNVLFISMFFTLVIHPSFLFDVGFQLSYVAVFSIAVFYPKLYSLLQPTWMVPDYYWKLCCVSLAAQLGVLPLSLFYFHQFPVGFLVTNMVVVPLLTIILCLGIPIIFTVLCGLFSGWICRLYSIPVKGLNSFIEWIASLEYFYLERIYFDVPMLIFSYLLLIFLEPLTRGFSKMKVGVPFFILLCLILYKVYTPCFSSDRLLIFHQSRHTLFARATNSKLLSLPSKDAFSLKILETYALGEYLKSNQVKTPVSLLAPFGIKLISRDTSYTSPNYGNPDKIYFLTGSPEINLDRVLEYECPDIVVADGNNYKTFVQRWKYSCQKQNIPFHYTGEKGCFEIYLKRED